MKGMKKLIAYALLFASLLALCSRVAASPGPENGGIQTDYLVYVGTYTDAQSEGIYVYRLALATGTLTPIGLAAKATNPSFLALHPNHHYLYAVNEVDAMEGRKTGGVSAYSIDLITGKLKFLNMVPSGDPGPCHVTVDLTGKYVLVANYGVGSVAVFPILSDGSLGKATAFLPHAGHSKDPKRQEGPHAHSIYTSPDNRFVVSADLGTDQVYIYRFDSAQGTLTPNDPPSVSVPLGSGPRHFAFDPAGKFGYVIEEMGSSLTAFSYDAELGQLRALETISTVPGDYKGYNDCAELTMHPTGRFLYGSNRGHNSITVFAVDPLKGTPAPIQYVSTQGKTPRSFGIDPTGNYLIAANQDSGSLVVFRINTGTGRLTPTGQKVDIRAPVCVVFEPAE